MQIYNPNATNLGVRMSAIEYVQWNKRYFMECLIDGLVYTNPDQKMLADVSIDDKVLGIDGHYHQISNIVRKKYNGKSIEVRAAGLLPVKVTPEHLFLTTSSKITRQKETNSRLRRPFGEIAWKEAKDLLPSDYVVVPIPSEVKDQSELVIETKLGPHVKDRISIDITEDFMELIGTFVAEGTCHPDGSLSFSFGKGGKEDAYCERTRELVSSILGLKPYEREQFGRVRQLHYSLKRVLDPIFSQFYIALPHHAINKCIPGWAMLLPPDKQAPLLRGFWRGDGCVSNSIPTASTVSQKLAIQMQFLLWRQKIFAGIHKSQHKKEILGRSVNSHANYVIRVFHHYANTMFSILNAPNRVRISEQRKGGILCEGHFLTPVRSISFHDYEGEIFDFTVPDLEAFVVNGAVLHNCPNPNCIFLKANGTSYKQERITTELLIQSFIERKPFRSEEPPH